MKTPSFALLFALFAGCYSCPGQQLKPPTSGAWITSDMLRTTDSVHYILKHSSKPAEGRFTINEVTAQPRTTDRTNDTSSPPQLVLQDRQSIGVFHQGVKTGTWVYYAGERKIREEQYANGRRVSLRKCPCKK